MFDVSGNIIACLRWEISRVEVTDLNYSTLWPQVDDLPDDSVELIELMDGRAGYPLPA